MDQRCNDCGNRVYEGADWCTVCYAPVPATADQATVGVPAHIGVPPAFKPYDAAPPAPAPSGLGAPDAVFSAQRAQTPAAAPDLSALAPPTGAPVLPAAPTGLAADTAIYRPERGQTVEPAPQPDDEPVWSADASVGLGWVPDANAGLTPVELTPVGRQEGVFGTAMALIGLGVVVDVGLYVWGRDHKLDASQMIADGLFAIAAFYAVAAGVILRKARRIAWRPLWTEGDPTEVLIRGLLTGAGLAGAVLVLLRLLTGHVASDASATAVIGEHSLPRTLAELGTACLAAPWVEELLFRGFLAESWRERGTRFAAFASGTMFAIWHPQALFPLLGGIFGGGAQLFVPFAYYVLMGAVFARIYLRSGLKGSIAAHTAFNGTLFLVALTVAGGSMHTVEAHGVRILAPTTWEATAAPESLAGADLVLQGPSGAVVAVEHMIAPDGVVSGSRAAELFKYAIGRFGDAANMQVGVTRLVDYPMGEAVHQEAVVDGHTVDFVLIVKGTTLYNFMFESQGSGRARQEFEDMLKHTILPEAPA